MRMMDEFSCDPLYTLLCVKQSCFRAQLTPKPSRVTFRGCKVKYPREGDDSEFYTNPTSLLNSTINSSISSAWV